MKKNSFLAFLFSLVLVVGICFINTNIIYATDDFEMGVSNLNGTTENSAKVGDVLKAPEKGWKRYDDTNSKIQFVEENNHRSSDATNTTYLSQYTVNYNTPICIKVYTRNLRLISCVSSENDIWRSNNILIEIDGQVSRFNQRGNISGNQEISFEKLNMENKVHYIKIYTDEQTTIATYHNARVIDVDAIDIDADGELLPYSVNENILNIEPEKEKIYLNDTVTANVTIDNITEIAAEDMIIKYDSEKLKFLGAEQVDGIKVVKDEESEGQLRVILASQGKDNIANAKKVLLKLNFQGIAVGDALVDITKGKISDGIEMERDLLDAECGQATITIEDYIDPNKNGEFTLLDLAIDGRYYGLNPSDYPQYKTDVVENGSIDDDDLLQIGQYMMENPNYKF